LADGGTKIGGTYRSHGTSADIDQLWIFVRDFSRLDAYGDDGLVKAATILHTVYQSFDLAAGNLTPSGRTVN
jgi:hypothetical protein